MKEITIIFWVFILPWSQVISQQCYWQQRTDYNMDIDFNVKKNCFEGKQSILLTNNSPDVLKSAYYHLYFNAFQPGSMMDVRSQTILDADPRVGGRISKLSEDEIGNHDIKWVKQDGIKAAFVIEGTILEVTLPKPVKPGETTELSMKFKSQVPVQIRRSGRDNSEGISYSMSQWYPKLCAYDEDGWHPNPYVGREFYGNWGDFDVSIKMDADYIIGGTGILKNPEEIGYGYGERIKKKSKKNIWKFRAENVHDFVWAADPDYTHDVMVREDGLVLHFFYQPGERTNDVWQKLPAIMSEAFDYINKKYGQYPYPQYSFIQGGDGGMEYPMATLITGERVLPSLVGVSVHELMHSWYQMMMGTNEALFAWMDEGFTSYATADVMNYLKSKGLIGNLKPVDDPWASSVSGYINFSKSGREEALITHADHFNTNQAYGVAAYVKGAVYLHQLSYIIGRSNLDRTLLTYYDKWRFKLPTANDFLKVAEDESGMVLDWYHEYWINSTHTIDYQIDTVKSSKRKTEITLKRVGRIPMPIDLYVETNDGDVYVYNIPLRIMRGAKTKDMECDAYETLEDWPWTNIFHTIEIDKKMSEIKSITIDKSGRMADVNRQNNVYTIDN